MFFFVYKYSTQIYIFRLLTTQFVLYHSKQLNYYQPFQFIYWCDVLKVTKTLNMFLSLIHNFLYSIQIESIYFIFCVWKFIQVVTIVCLCIENETNQKGNKYIFI